MLAVNIHGSTPETAIVCGNDILGDVPRLCEATGLVFAIRKGQQRWVRGDAVDKAIIVGGFIVIEGEPPPPPEERPTELPDGTPGSEPDLPGRLDQWKVAFTPCVECGLYPADPGEELCHACLAAASGESPLERALRLAGT